MQENIYGDIWGETLHKKDIGMRVYLYNEHSIRYTPALILDNKLAINSMITFLKKCKEEINGNKRS